MIPSVDDYEKYIEYLKNELDWWKTQYYEKVGDDYFAEVEYLRNQELTKKD